MTEDSSRALKLESKKEPKPPQQIGNRKRTISEQKSFQNWHVLPLESCGREFQGSIHFSADYQHNQQGQKPLLTILSGLEIVKQALLGREF